MDYLFHIVPVVAVGLQITLKIFIITIVLSLPLGILMAIGRISKIAILRKAMYAYIYVMRGTPLMLQILFIYYGLPFIIDGLKLPAFPAAIIAFVLNYAAYFAEIFRGGIQGVPKGQQEAGQVLGMTSTQIFFKVTLLQMVKRIVPPMSNEIITLVKDTSLSRIIALQEIIWAGQAFLKGSQGISGAIWPLFFTGIYYLLFSGVLQLLLDGLEKKLDYFKA